MTETFDIAGYVRISVDDEKNQKNISIENQKAIIEDYVHTRFPGSTLTFFEDRDRSGYTFEQREGYQEMRRGLMTSHDSHAATPEDWWNWRICAMQESVSFPSGTTSTFRTTTTG